ncbi:MAG: phosphate ABC transporter substrate-binding protein [Lachnospiraceae bacterium]
MRMKKGFALLLAGTMMLSATACSNAPDSSSSLGENSVESSVQPEVSSSVNNEVSSQILFNGSSTLAPVITAIALEFNETYTTWDAVDPSLPNENIAIYVSSGGSGQGAKARIENTTDFGMLAREVKDSERESIPDCREYLVGIDALTLAIHPDNPIVSLHESLSTEEIVKIFSGEYATWQDLDPSLPAEEIIVVTRDIGGGAHEVFQNKIMGDVDVKPEAIQAPSMGALVTRIAENPYAIGYASFGVANQNTGSIVMLQVDGIEPTVENIQNGSYIIQRPLVLLGSGDPTPVEQAFLEVVLGERGQAIIEEMGFIAAR